jgi:hypothetical protein
MNSNFIKVALIILCFYQCGCTKKNVLDKRPSPYFIKASFNGIQREITENTQFSYLSFQAQLNRYNNRWRINMISDNDDKDTICRGIWISFDYVPTVGKHYFNNLPLSSLPDSGMIGYYTYFNTISDGPQARYTKDGYVDVTEIGRDDFKGTFTFNAVAESSTDTTVIAVTKGSFYLHNYGGGDNWPGP